MSNYVSDQVLDRIRQATDITALVRNIVPLKKSGSGQIGLCPFHKEKTPSFHVNTEKQIFKCFGCGVGGDVFSFVMKTDGVGFMEAVRLLAERAHIELPERDGHGAAAGREGAPLRGERLGGGGVPLLADSATRPASRRSII